MQVQSSNTSALNETLIARINHLAADMERYGLKADAAILRGLTRSLPSELATNPFLARPVVAGSRSIMLLDLGIE